MISLVFMNCGSAEETNSSRGSVLDGIDSSPSETVRKFINHLGKRDFRAAFKLSSVPAWGDYDKFSSNRYFGGIDFTDIKSLQSKGFENEYAIVEVLAFYRDPINSSATFQQTFYLKQFGDKWIIMKMKQEKVN
jgi:hypothetical protein